MPTPFDQATQRRFLPPGGGLFGAPSPQFVQQDIAARNRAQDRSRAEAAGRGTQQVLAKAAELAQQGMKPQQIIQQILGSPEFRTFFSSPEFNSGALPKLIQQIANPEPQSFTLSQGQQRFERDPTTGETRQTAAVPPLESQRFDHLAEIARLDPDDREALARATIGASQRGDKTAAERATSRLVETGKMTPETRDKILSGALKVTPVRNPVTGETEAVAITDLTTGETEIAGGQNRPTLPSQSDPNNADQKQGAVPSGQTRAIENMADPANMFNAAGPVGGVVEFGSGIGGAVSGNLVNREVVESRTAMRQLRFSMNQLRRRGGRAFANDSARLEALMPSMGVLTNPTNEMQKAIQLHDFLTGKLQQEQARRLQRNISPKVRLEADQTIRDIENVLSHLPDREAMLAKLEEFRRDGGGAFTLERGANALRDMGKKAQERLEGTEDQPQKPFNEMTGPELKKLLDDPNLAQATVREILRVINERLGITSATP